MPIGILHVAIELVLILKVCLGRSGLLHIEATQSFLTKNNILGAGYGC